MTSYQRMAAEAGKLVLALSTVFGKAHAATAADLRRLDYVKDDCWNTVCWTHKSFIAEVSLATNGAGLQFVMKHKDKGLPDLDIRCSSDADGVLEALRYEAFLVVDSVLTRLTKSTKPDVFEVLQRLVFIHIA
jgi:hypothetical protein